MCSLSVYWLSRMTFPAYILNVDQLIGLNSCLCPYYSFNLLEGTLSNDNTYKMMHDTINLVLESDLKESALIVSLHTHTHKDKVQITWFTLMRATLLFIFMLWQCRIRRSLAPPSRLLATTMRKGMHTWRLSMKDSYHLFVTVLSLPRHACVALKRLSSRPENILS